MQKASLSLFSLVKIKSEIVFQILTTHNHLTFSPTPTKLGKTFSIQLPEIQLHPLPLVSQLYQQHHFTIKFKTDTHDLEDKNITEQQRVDSCTPKMVKPLTIVPSIDSKKKIVSMSSTKKRKPVKKGNLKEVENLVEKENPLKATVEGTTTQASKNIDNEEAYKITSEVAILVCEKGNPDSILNVDVPIYDKNTGSVDSNIVIKISKNMNVDTGNETRANDSVESDPEESEAQEDVDTSLGQPDNPIGGSETMTSEKDLSFETTPEKNLNSGNFKDNSNAEENRDQKVTLRRMKRKYVTPRFFPT